MNKFDVYHILGYNQWNTLIEKYECKLKESLDYISEINFVSS